MLGAMVKEINEQFHLHPEWTDVLMEEKRSITDSLKALGKDEFTAEDAVKGELLKIWRKGEERWKLMWGRAIRFIYNAENSTHLEIETLLS